MNTEALKKSFKDLYQKEAEALFFSPGRVNLIGEHTDYNGGYVFPCALNFGTYLLVRKNNEKVVRFASTNMDLKVDLSLDKLGDTTFK